MLGWYISDIPANYLSKANMEKIKSERNKKGNPVCLFRRTTKSDLPFVIYINNILKMEIASISEANHTFNVLLSA